MSYTIDDMIEQARNQQRVDSHIDSLSPLYDETPPHFEWNRALTEQDRAEFYQRFEVEISRPSVSFSL